MPRRSLSVVSPVGPAVICQRVLTSGLDNLPGEVTFLLEEISEKDRKITSESGPPRMSDARICAKPQAEYIPMTGLMTRINLRHYTLTKNIKSAPPSSQPSTPGTPTFVLPIPAGAELPVGHLSQKEQQAITKIIAEWAKVEQITSRARERGRAEWKKVGGMDLDEIEKSEGPRNGFGEMGGTEVLLPPSGLGSGSDGRPKSELGSFEGDEVICADGRTETERITPPTPFCAHHAPSSRVDAASAGTATQPFRPPNQLATRQELLHVDFVGRSRRRWRDGIGRSRGRGRSRRHALLFLSAKELRRDDRVRQLRVRVRMGESASKSGS